MQTRAHLPHQQQCMYAHAINDHDSLWQLLAPHLLPLTVLLLLLCSCTTLSLWHLSHPLISGHQGPAPIRTKPLSPCALLHSTCNLPSAQKISSSADNLQVIIVYKLAVKLALNEWQHVSFLVVALDRTSLSGCNTNTTTFGPSFAGSSNAATGCAPMSCGDCCSCTGRLACIAISWSLTARL